MVPVSLIVVSNTDIASLIQGEELLELGNWTVGDVVEGCETHKLRNVRIWWLNSGLLWEDDLDERWMNSTGEIPFEVIFPSRHSAASGRPSLTIHPIGIPHLGMDEKALFGGIQGKAPPPNTRLGPWFREIKRSVHASDIFEEFECSLEVTHHGPWLKTPSLFIEIGSTETHWDRRDAAKILADVIWRGLGLDDSDGIGNWSSSNVGHKVIIGIGGGHYAPLLGRLVENNNIWIGHMLSNYTLPMIKPNNEDWDPDSGILPDGNWKQAIDEALRSTKKAFPDGEIWAYVDRKSFKGWQRRSILKYLDSIGISVGRSRDFQTH